MNARPFALGLLLAAPPVHAVAWADLWQRPDQQTYGGRRGAYDQIQAQRYGAAAKQLLQYPDPESQYNRGNALARAGDLPGALSAYEAALQAAAPDSSVHRDAEHNRDLVRSQLQKQNQKQDQDQKQGRKQDQQQGQDTKQATDGKQGQDGKQAQDAKQDQKQGQGQSAQQDSRPGQGEDQKQDQKQDQKLTQDQGQEPPRRAVAPGKDQSPPGAAEAKSKSAAPADQFAAASAASAATPPATEQALSLDQWLRWIPDDPSGLLRRKFLIEHKLKQREAPP